MNWEKIKASIRESFWEHEQVVQLRQKFAELDPKTQAIVQLSSVGVGALLLLAILGSLISGSSERKGRIDEIDSLVRYAKDASGKIQASRRAGPSLQGISGVNVNAPLPEVLEQVALRASIGRGSIDIVEGDPAVLKLSKVSIRQLVRLFYALENNLPNVEWKKLSLDSKGDKQGYFWVDLEVRRSGGQ